VRIEVVGRNVEVTEELRGRIHKLFRRVANQVSELARLEVVLRSEPNASVSEVAEATLYLKGTTLHAEESERTMTAAIRHVASDLKRQVKRDRELRRSRPQSRRLAGRMRRSA
jgi:putative sigma-54 modulation protein